MAVRVAFLWHMHQPMYVEPATGEAVLPWVRLHATHAYYDMGRLLERHPEVRCTVNFVPSLLEQLEHAAQGTRPERFLELTRARPEDLSFEERAFILRQFFMVSREHGIRPHPRYMDLLQRRGDDPQRIDVLRFSDQDVRDLQVLFNLAWMGFAARQDEPDIARLVQKGGHFDEEDKAALLGAQQRILQRIVPLWRALQARGQIELSATPYYHPILPLLCDTDAARRAMPQARLPARFSYPEDAHEQVRRAIVAHARWFGARPDGMWPAEGSVSPEALEVFASEGIRWVATDEGNLFRSQPAPSHRGALYQPWACETPAGRISVGFRDRSLSDKLGFTYSRMRADEAVEDFLASVRRAESDARQAGVDDPVVFVVLDGENAWEYYPEHGERFLDSLYAALGAAEDVTTVQMGEALAQPAATLAQIHSGSWIESSYRIWISHPEDNLAWDLLGQVRALVERHELAGDVDAARLARAKELLLQAEGSDWFWWYGDDFRTDNAAEFDALFRERLILAATLVGEPAPARATEPLSRQARSQASEKATQQPPVALIRPRVDGLANSFTEWLGAGWVRPETGQGSMFQGEQVLDALYFGTDLELLYLRLDARAALVGSRIVLDFRPAHGKPRLVTLDLAGRGSVPIKMPRARAVLGDTLELALPLEQLGVRARDRLELVVKLERDGAELERLPRAAALSFEVPDAEIEQRHWVV